MTPMDAQVLAAWFRDAILAVPGDETLNEEMAALPMTGWVQEMYRVRSTVEAFVKEGLQHANAYHPGQQMALTVSPSEAAVEALATTLTFSSEAVLDTACVVTLHGDAWAQQMEELLWKEYALVPRTEATEFEVVGVGGVPIVATVMKIWPVGLFGHAGEIRSIELP